MTAQIQDCFVLDGLEYVIVGVKGNALFCTEEVGILPTMISTACYRGFHARYQAVDGLIVLTELTVRAFDDAYPTIGGVEAVFEADQHLARYTGLVQPVNFTGGLLIAADFINTLYVHMGFQKATAYRRVLELRVAAGEIRAVDDQSERVGQLRVNVLNRAGLAQRQGSAWINHMFSLDYEV